MTAEEFFGNGNSSCDVNETLYTFGNYKIKGDLEIVGIFSTEKIKSTLYYNHTKEQFFLLKEFQSGKNHIDFFLNFDNIEPGLFFDKPGIFKVKVAFSISGNQKLLSFDFSKNVYIIQSEDLGNSYISYYQKVRK